MNSAEHLDEVALRRNFVMLTSKHQQTQMPKRRKHKKIRNKLRKVGSTAIAKQKKAHHVNALITKLESDNNAFINQIKQLKQLRKLEIIKAYNDGVREFAWWKDGVQYVGVCGRLLKDALKNV